MLHLFHKYFPSDWENPHTSFYERELKQGIKTAQVHVAEESIDGSPRRIKKQANKGIYN